MKKTIRLLCFVLAVLMLVSAIGCGKKKTYKKDPLSTQQKLQQYVGTWQGSDHDGENVVHYLVFDEEGYWNIYMDLKPLTTAIKQLPDQLVSFKIFTQLQKSGQTGCHYEYIKNDGNINYADYFTIDKDGRLAESGTSEVYFTRISEESGAPAESIVSEARDLFDLAREKALS